MRLTTVVDTLVKSNILESSSFPYSRVRTIEAREKASTLAFHAQSFRKAAFELEVLFISLA